MALKPVKTANKTFHVSRQPQYTRNRRLNPLSPLNQERPSRRSSCSKDRNSPSACPQDLSKSVKADLENMPLQKNSPLVLLVPANKLLDSSDKADISSVPLPKEVRVLNKTLSPISTPERFSKPPMSCFQSPLPVIGKIVKDGRQEPGTPTLSVKDALAVIESDLTHAVSPPNACSSFNFSDSLETEHLKTEYEPEAAVGTDENVPPLVDVAQPRLTFFVKSNKVLEAKSGHDSLKSSTAVCPATVTKTFNTVDDDLNEKCFKSKKTLFNSATVTKGKAETSIDHSPGTRKIRTSRRRLLEKTSLLSDSSNAESNPILSQGVLPVNNCDLDIEFKFKVTSPPVSPQHLMPHRPTLPDRSAATFVPLQPISTTDAEPAINGTLSASSHVSEMLSSNAAFDSFPVHSQSSNQNKKRKSEEFSRDCSDDVAKSFQVKKGCAEMQERKKPCPDKRFSSWSGSTQCKPAGK